MIITSLIKYCLDKLGFNNEVIDTTSFGYYWSVPFAFIVLLPLCLMTNVSAFRYVSMLSLVALAYTSIVLIVEAPQYYRYFSTVSKITPAYIDANIFTGCAMTFFSYACQI